MAIAVLIVGGVVGGLFIWNNLFSGQLRYRGLVGDVKEELFQIAIQNEGTLEAADNNDIHCQVKSNKKGGTQIKIKDIKVTDGQYVKEGQVLLVLDDTPLQTELTDQEIIEEDAKGKLEKAQEDVKIALSQKQTDELAADNAVELAKIEKDKYLNGDFEVLRNDLEKKKKDAESDLQQWIERVSWSKLMYSTGNLSKAQMESDSAKLDSTIRTWQNVEKELFVLKEFTLRKMEIDLAGKLSEAKLAKTRAYTQAKAKLDQAVSEEKVKKKIYNQECLKTEEIRDQLKLCTIVSPADGLCIFYMPPQSRFGGGSKQTLVAQGEPVDYNQKLMQIPDLSKMIVKAKIPQAMVKYLRNEDPNYPEKSQKAFITVDGYGDQLLKGHVKAVANTSSALDWSSGDIKVYETEILIDEAVRDLKPGMSAKVSVIAYQSPKPVLTIPIQAVVGSITSGKERKVYVVDDSGYAELRDIKIGMNNERVVEVLDGLKRGEKVALDPSVLIGGDSHLRPAKTGKDKGSEGGGDGAGDGEGAPKKGDPTKKGKGGDPSKKGGPPGGQPGGQKGPGAGDGVSQPDFKAKMEAFQKQFATATPEQRRDMISKIPDASAQQKIRDQAKAQGLEVAD